MSQDMKDVLGGFVAILILIVFAACTVLIVTEIRKEIDARRCIETGYGCQEIMEVEDDSQNNSNN